MCCAGNATPYFPESDVNENMRIAGYLRSASDRKEAMETVFHLFPTLLPLRKRKAGFLSGGEQQMLAIGMALMAGPSLLMLDEPLLGLSPAMQTALVRAIKAVRESTGVTHSDQRTIRPAHSAHDRSGVCHRKRHAHADGAGQELMDNPEIKSAYFGV